MDTILLISLQSSRKMVIIGKVSFTFLILHLNWWQDFGMLTYKNANILALPYLTVCMHITKELLSRFARNIILEQGCTDFCNI